MNNQTLGMESKSESVYIYGKLKWTWKVKVDMESEAEGAEGPLEQPDSEDFYFKISSCIYDWVKF